MKVSVIGTGYVGLNTAAALAYIGHSVVGIDVDKQKVEMLNNKVSPISEEGLDELLSYDNMNIEFSTSYSKINESDVIFIAVGTPSKEDGSADLKYIMSVAEKLKNELNPTKDITVVVKSTVPFGVNEYIERIIRGKVEKENKLHFASNPEFLREGTALLDTFFPDRIIVGTNDEYAGNALKELYKKILERSFEFPKFIKNADKYKGELPKLLITDRVSAEMIKYASNSFLALKISYANEIEKLAEKIGANMHDISIGMGMDKRIAPYFLNSGLGWGGSCFPKDTLAIMAIAKDYNIDMPIVEAAVKVNNNQIDRVVQKVLSELHTLYGKKIAVFGITFKPKTDDVRNSLSVELCYKLKELGADIYATDPCGLENAKVIYKDSGFTFCDTPYEAAQNADAVIIATEWEDYKSLDYKKIKESMRDNNMFDTRNILYGSQNKELFNYHHM